MLARDPKELEAPIQCAFVVLRAPGRRNTVADALSRFAAWAQGGGQIPNRELRRRFRRDVDAHRGRMDVDMMANDGGSNAWCPSTGPRPTPRPKARFPREGCGGPPALTW